MADDGKKLKEELLKQQGRAIVKAGKDAARRIYDDLTLSDEEKAQRELERAREAKLKRWKWIAIGAGSLIAVVTLFVIIAKLWIWIVALAVLAALGFVAYSWAKKKLTAPEVKVRIAEEPEPAPKEPVTAPVRERTAEEVRAEAVAKEKAIDDELAALKARTKR
jgi:hypothetical protein